MKEKQLNRKYKPHIEITHQAWRNIVRPGDLIIDATCGNGNDTLLLAQLALTSDSGTVYALDIQSQALNTTRELLFSSLDSLYVNKVKFIQGCHSKFPTDIESNSIKLIVYNLGYLPRSDKIIKTRSSSTLASLISALGLLMKEGVICITFYPGHPEGEEEENVLFSYISTLDSRLWECLKYNWINRPKSPNIIFLKKLF